MFIELKSLDLDALKETCNRLDLVHHERCSFRYGRLDFPNSVPDGISIENRACDGVLALRDPQPIAGGRRYPFEIGIFADGGRYFLVWDDYRGGFGLSARIGDNGERLLQTYATVVVEKILEKYQVSVRVTADETVELTAQTGDDMNQKIVVRISPKGQVKMEVVGCEGESCKSLTEAMERALGKVTEDELMPEFYKAQDQNVTQTVSE